ncbi:Intermediate capsid protein VP6, partial [Bienertia sinuspersici]
IGFPYPSLSTSFVPSFLFPYTDDLTPPNHPKNKFILLLHITSHPPLTFSQLAYPSSNITAIMIFQVIARFSHKTLFLLLLHFLTLTTESVLIDT